MAIDSDCIDNSWLKLIPDNFFTKLTLVSRKIKGQKLSIGRSVLNIEGLSRKNNSFVLNFNGNILNITNLIKSKML